MFEDNNILVNILSAHSSTILQPLDLTVNGELKRLLRQRFKAVKGEDIPTKRSRLMYTTVECLQVALTGIYITDGFERAGIWPFSVDAPLKSNLIIHKIDLMDFAPPSKRKRGPTIAGQVLTFGEPTPMLECEKTPPSAPPSTVLAPKPTPLKPAPKTTPGVIVTKWL